MILSKGHHVNNVQNVHWPHNVHHVHEKPIAAKTKIPIPADVSFLFLATFFLFFTLGNMMDDHEKKIPKNRTKHEHYGEFKTWP